jgi:uncharacterized membrane protein
MKVLSSTISLVLVVSLAGCVGMMDEQQRLVSGGAMGAAGGAVLGAVTGSVLIGAAVGSAVGVAGGAIVNEQHKAKASKSKKKKAATPQPGDKAN